MNSKQQAQPGGSRVKKLAAVIGASAVVTMGALTVAIRGNEAHAENEFEGAGETITKSTAPTEIETSVAEPEVKAEPYEP